MQFQVTPQNDQMLDMTATLVFGREGITITVCRQGVGRSLREMAKSYREIVPETLISWADVEKYHSDVDLAPEVFAARIVQQYGVQSNG